MNPYTPTPNTNPPLGLIRRNRRRRELIVSAVLYTLPIWPAIIWQIVNAARIAYACFSLR